MHSLPAGWLPVWMLRLGGDWGGGMGQGMIGGGSWTYPSWTLRDLPPLSASRWWLGVSVYAVPGSHREVSKHGDLCPLPRVLQPCGDLCGFFAAWSFWGTMPVTFIFFVAGSLGVFPLSYSVARRSCWLLSDPSLWPTCLKTAPADRLACGYRRCIVV